MASGALHTTASDYALFLSALLSDAALLKRIAAQAVAVPGHPALRWGLGWGIEPRQGDDAVLWHWGSNPGYRSLALVSLRARCAIVVFTSSERGMPAAIQLARLAIPGELACLSFPMLR